MKRRLLLIGTFLATLAAIGLRWDAVLGERGTANPLPQDWKADKILVEKGKRQMHLLVEGAIMKSYQIALGFDPIGHKQQQGDGRTPEGLYQISGRNPKSAYHLSLRVSYPSVEDRKNAGVRGVNPGGDIFIHGLPNGWPMNSAPKVDWTAGCIAVNNDEIEEIWKAVDNGIPIEIKP